MALTINHAYTAVGTDAGNGEVNKARWNAALIYSGTVDVANGGTGKTTPEAGGQVFNTFLPVTSSGGTTTLTAASQPTVIITGSSAQTIVLPDVTTLALGWTFTIVNANTSTGTVTVQSSGLNSFPSTINANQVCVFKCVAVTGTGTASWQPFFIGATSRVGSGTLVYNFAPTIQQGQITSANAFTAGTNAQGQGVLSEHVNIITTAANNPSGVTLPTPGSSTASKVVTVINKGANPVNVYPASGGTIDALAANASILLPVSGVMTFWSASTTQWYSDASIGFSRAANVPYIFSQSSVAISGTAVTTEEVYKTITIPGGAVGPNGMVQIFTNWTTTSNANNKSLNIRVGGVAGTLYMQVGNTTHVGATRNTVFVNNNSESAQKTASPAGNTQGTGNFSAAGITSTVNTAAAWDIVISGTKAVSTDTITLESYQVLISYGA